MGRNSDVNTFLLDDQINTVRETWKKGMNAMKDSGSKDSNGKAAREADWNVRIKMMMFWKDCTIIRSRDVDSTYADVKSAFDLKKVRDKQLAYQKKVN